MSAFPQRRLRRLRRTGALRQLRRETHLHPADLIQPLFVVDRPELAREVPAMPGVFRYTIEQLGRPLEQIQAAGVPAILLFGLPGRKDAAGSGAAAEDGVIPRAVRSLRDHGVDLAIVTDVCLCGYTDHGHCGIVRDDHIVNDETLETLARAAVVYAQAGADVVAPSAMLDGMVAALRRALDHAGQPDTAILSYAVKYASAFYGPFRDAADCAPKFGDRRTHQMDPANRGEALAEAELDLAEGADVLMVKPGLPYLDVIHALKERFPQMPLAAYQVSGEYSMIKAAAARGWLDETRAVEESVVGLKRAGADVIISYFATDLAQRLSS